MTWLEALTHLHEQGEAAVLVTLVAVRGHAPREAGAKMVVGLEATWDSVGGGNLEATAVARARALLAVGGSAPELLTLRLTDQAANEYGRQCCGGEVTLLLEPLMTVRPHVAVFGVGHVGLELALILARMPLNLHLVDSRAAQLMPERLTGVQGRAKVHVHHAPIPEMVLADLPAGALVLILTHDHAEDIALCDAALRRPELGFIGLIGSTAKWSRFRQQLLSAGHAPDDLKRITSPLGLPGIAGKAPAVIGLSMAAQVVQELEKQRQPATPHPTPYDLK